MERCLEELCVLNYEGYVDFTEFLISEVHPRPALWDPKHPEFNNQSLRTSLYGEISYSMRIPPDVIQSRWSHITNKYSIECRKEKLHRRHSIDRFRSTWPYFSMLEFMKLSNISVQNYVSKTCSKQEKRKQRKLKKLIQQSKKQKQTKANNRKANLNKMNNRKANLNKMNDGEANLNDTNNGKVNSAKTNNGEANLNKTNNRKANLKKMKKFVKSMELSTNNNEPIEVIEIKEDEIEENKMNMVETNDVPDNTHQYSNKLLKLLLEHNITPSSSNDMIFFHSLIPFMKRFSEINKLKVRTKIQNIILEEWEKQEKIRFPSNISDISNESHRFNDSVSPELTQSSFIPDVKSMINDPLSQNENEENSNSNNDAFYCTSEEHAIDKDDLMSINVMISSDNSSDRVITMTSCLKTESKNNTEEMAII